VLGLCGADPPGTLIVWFCCKRVLLLACKHATRAALDCAQNYTAEGTGRLRGIARPLLLCSCAALACLFAAECLMPVFQGGCCMRAIAPCDAALHTDHNALSLAGFCICFKDAYMRLQRVWLYWRKVSAVDIPCFMLLLRPSAPYY
jgi:hypothetical protein